MYKLGIIGYPLGHSISAVIQKAGFESLNLEGSYDVLETPPEELIPRIKFLKTNGYNGFNVTIPLKVPMSLFLDDIDDYANIAGCVNTVKVQNDSSFIGYNTDIYGFKDMIYKKNPDYFKEIKDNYYKDYFPNLEIKVKSKVKIFKKGYITGGLYENMEN